jgi:hypothetical protein
MHPATSNQPANKKPVFWIFITALIGLTLFIGINNYLRGDTSSDLYPEDAARDEVRVKNLADLKTENEAKLHSYAWVDRAKGKIQIPIEEAMKLVLVEIGGKKPTATYPIVSVESAMSAPAPAAPAPAAPVSAAPVSAAPVSAAPVPVSSAAPQKEPSSAREKSSAKGTPKSAKPDKVSKP